MRGLETADMTGPWCGCYNITRNPYEPDAAWKCLSPPHLDLRLRPHRSPSVPARFGERKIISPNAGLDKESGAEETDSSVLSVPQAITRRYRGSLWVDLRLRCCRRGLIYDFQALAVEAETTKQNASVRSPWRGGVGEKCSKTFLDVSRANRPTRNLNYWFSYAMCQVKITGDWTKGTGYPEVAHFYKLSNCDFFYLLPFCRGWGNKIKSRRS